MPLPICSKCENPFFEVQQYNPPGVTWRIEVLTCTMCGAVASTFGHTSFEMLADINKRVAQMHQWVERIYEKLNA